MRKAPLLFALLILPAPLLSSPVLAQTLRPPVGSPSRDGTQVSLPPPLVVDDPMLAPMPAPPRVLASWQQAIGYLRARSTDLRIALDQALQAEAQTRTALAAYLPSINGTGTYTHNILTNRVASGALVFQANGGTATTTRVPLLDAVSGTIALQQAIFNAPAFDQISIDELNEDATRLSVDDQKRTLALSVANQIVSVVTAEREAEINRVGLRVALEQLAITTRKQALGAANGLDVVRAQQNASSARATLVKGDESLREARESLGLALGIPEETGVAPDVDINGIVESATSSCRVVPDVDQRSDVAAAHTRLEVAKRNLRNVSLQFLPTVTAQSTLAANSSASTVPNPTWSIQGLLQVPLWDGGARYGGLRNARAAEDIAAQQLEALRRQAVIQVEQAQRQLVVAEVSDKIAREQRDLAATNDQMTETAYMAGQGTSLELVTASEAHRSAELNLALQDFTVVKARILAVLALATCPW